MADNIIKTAFHNFHVAAGAKMVDFAGYRMPIQYKGITEEHLAVRRNVGMFDLSHMGEFEVSGKDAVEFLQEVTTNNVDDLNVGQIQYTCMTKPDGGIVDDLLLYRLEGGYLMVVNAANIKKDLAWLQEHLEGGVELNDRSLQTSLLAIQGPNAERVMALLTDYELDNLPYYNSVVADVAGQDTLFSRTGYTGEDGFEIYIPPDHAETVWKAAVEAGKKHDMALVGLGARDSLRMEMKMALYGNDIDETTNPVEAGLSWIVDWDKEFIGREALLKVKQDKPSRRLVCIELDGKAFPRAGYEVFDGERKIGNVTSGTFSPSLQKPIAIGYVERSHSKSGSEVRVMIRDKEFPAVVVKPPFYKDASHK